MFIGKNLFVNEKCIMYGHRCSNSGFIIISHDKKEIIVYDGDIKQITIPFDNFKEEYYTINELYRRILFLRFGVSV
jgi:hypothetical protein